MNLFTGIIVYLVIFWTALFMILPWGNTAAEVPEGGQSPGAPINPRIRQKFIVTAIVSLALWIIVFLLVHYEVIDFHAIARQMVEEDKAL